MAKLKIRTHYFPADSLKQIEQSVGKSETIQGETKSIAQLLQKEMHGLVQERKKVAFLDSEDLDKINKFYRPLNDLTDLDEFKSYAADLQSKIKAFEMERQKSKENEKSKLAEDDSQDKGKQSKNEE